MPPSAPAPADTRPNLYGLGRERLRALTVDSGVPSFHGDQIYRWLYGRGSLDPADWTDLPKDLRARIASAFRIDPGTIDGRTEASDGTIKYRIAFPGGGVVEAVHMVQRERVTLCVSSQVGCALSCDFCLTGRMGLERHLEAGEIVGQVDAIRRDRAIAGRPFNVVFMGMGEPFHNYDAVLAAVRILADPEGFALSRRRLTVSTVGIVPAIERLAGEEVRPRLAVSLNATTDALRDRIMPINRRWPLDALLAACAAFAEATGDRPTFEYVLLEGINDGAADVQRLDRILASSGAKLNLIPFNPVPGWLDYRAPGRDRVVEIRDRLLAAGRRVSVRWSRGLEARAACGQLALLPERPGPLLERKEP